MGQIGLVVCGSVACNRSGARLGKGGGYSDLEYAMARQFKKASKKTPTVTTIHPTQLLGEKIPMKPHDFPLDYIVTTDEVIQTNTRFRRPAGIDFSILRPEYANVIPALKEGW